MPFDLDTELDSSVEPRAPTQKAFAIGSLAAPGTIGGTTPGAGHFSTLSASGATALDSTLDVNGAANFDGAVTATDALTVTGAAAFNGGIACDTDKFTVANTSGNTRTKGTLIVDLTTTLTGVTTPTGGIAAAGGFSVSARNIHTGGNPASAAADGTNLSVVVTELYVAEVKIPANCTVTGVSVFWGDATEGNAKVMLFDSTGARVAISASTDVSGFTTDSYGTRIAFSAPYAAVGPATYYVGVICDINTNRINTHVLGDFGAGKIGSLVYGTEAGYATITPPTTFSTGLGPIASLY